MDVLVKLIRILTAVISPLSVFLIAGLTACKASKDKGRLSEESQHCLRCGGSARGAEGHFYFTEKIGSGRERAFGKQLAPGDTPILGNETYFICDRCAFRFIRNEIFQLVLMILPYPLYLVVIVPMFAETSIFANFLIETLLVVLSVGGFVSILDLFRAVRYGESPLGEARDRVAIHERKNALGKKFSYYTRMGISQLKKR
jgi:hypothetical protein